LGDVTSSSSKPTSQRWWWLGSILLVVVGVVGIVFAPHNPAVGPLVLKPVGEVTLPSSGVVMTTPTTSAPRHSTTTTFRASTTIHSTPTTVRSATTSRPVPTTSPTVAPPVYVARPVKRSRPVSLSIPKIGLLTPLSRLGLNADGSVMVPTDFNEPGWFDRGVTPGERGSAVILGHVDNFHGAAVFYHLDQLTVGDRVIVTLADHRRLTFAVIGVRMFQKTTFPDKLVYGFRPYPAMQIVTCGGIFDSATGHYLSNIVVFTAMVKS